MADAPVGIVFLGPADVMKDGGDLENPDVGAFFRSDAKTEAEDALRVVPSMAASRVFKKPAGVFFNRAEQGI